MIRVQISGERPDFRVFIDLLYSDGRNVDTDGDSNLVWSRVWTDLYIKDRESSDPFVEISASSENPNLFEVISESERLEELASIYLFDYCGVSIEKDDKKFDAVEIDRLKDKYSDEINRANESIWHKSSENNPYPNLAE